MFQHFSPLSSASFSKTVRGAWLFAVFAFLVISSAAPSIEAATEAAGASESASSLSADSPKQTATVKIQPETNSPAVRNQYNLLESTVNSCDLASVVTEPAVREILAPAGSLCINGALAVADPDFNRPLTSSTGTGIGNGVVGNCSLSGTATAANYDVYSFNLTGCAAFPTEVTATLCGPAGCQHVGNVDTTLVLYRNVAAGDPLTANGGLGNTFNPASPCTNARGGQDDLGTTSGTPNNPGGATCNQAVPANCVAPCTTPSNAGGLSGLRRNLGSGNFTLVVAGFGNATVGGYNLFVNAPAAGCNVVFAPTAAAVSISGKVTLPENLGLTNALVTLTDFQGNARTVRTGKFGAYRFENVEAGATYILTVVSKRYTFEPRYVTANEDLTDVNFTAQ